MTRNPNDYVKLDVRRPAVNRQEKAYRSTTVRDVLPSRRLRKACQRSRLLTRPFGHHGSLYESKICSHH